MKRFAALATLCFAGAIPVVMATATLAAPLPVRGSPALTESAPASTSSSTTIIGPVLPEPQHFPGGSVVQPAPQQHTAPTPSTGASSLPLTGRRVGGLSAAGLALFAIGTMLVLRSRRRPAHARRRRAHARR